MAVTALDVMLTDRITPVRSIRRPSSTETGNQTTIPTATTSAAMELAAWSIVKISKNRAARPPSNITRPTTNVHIRG